MEKGTYNRHRVNFAEYAVTCFTPHLFTAPIQSMSGCGAGALGLLTGVPPIQIRQKHKAPHFSDKFMIRFLRQRGYSAKQLTLCNLSNSKSNVTKNNLLLISQLFRRNEATWLVLLKDICYHNFETYTLEALSFLNKPILSAYVITHPSWQMDMSISKESISYKQCAFLNFEQIRKTGLLPQAQGTKL